MQKNLNQCIFRPKNLDAVKMRLFQMCQWAGLEAEVEVFNLFAGRIPQEGLSRMERGRKVQSIVPDMMISVPEEGNFVPRLHELKIISSSKTRYTPHRQGQEATRAVDKRASELNGEYIKKARTTDQLYCGTAPGTTGPVETKLARLGNVKGIVVGAFGEGSEDLHSLIHHLAFSRGNHWSRCCCGGRKEKLCSNERRADLLSRAQGKALLR